MKPLRLSFRDRLATYSGDNYCWLWPQKTGAGGYAYTSVPDGNKPKGKRVSAHRLAWEILRGPIPKGLVLDHLCRNRHCINPAHMEAVTQGENLKRGETRTAENVRKTKCPQGHPYDIFLTVSGGPARRCSICIKARKKKYYDRDTKDPDRLARRKAISRKFYESLQADPAKAEKHKEYHRQQYAKRKHDPEKREALNAYQREYQKRKRAGKRTTA